MHNARFTLRQRRQQVDRDAGSVQLAALGRMRFRVAEPLVGRLSSMTISRDAADRWFRCVTADGVPAPVSPVLSRAIAGLDFDLKDTAVPSDGTRVAAPQHLARHQRRLRRFDADTRAAFQ